VTCRRVGRYHSTTACSRTNIQASIVKQIFLRLLGRTFRRCDCCMTSIRRFSQIYLPIATEATLQLRSPTQQSSDIKRDRQSSNMNHVCRAVVYSIYFIGPVASELSDAYYLFFPMQGHQPPPNSLFQNDTACSGVLQTSSFHISVARIIRFVQHAVTPFDCSPRGGESSTGIFQVEPLTKLSSVRERITISTTASIEPETTAISITTTEAASNVDTVAAVAWFLAEYIGTSAAAAALKPNPDWPTKLDDKTCPDLKLKSSDCTGKRL